MQMKSVSKVQFGRLNDKRFYFYNKRFYSYNGIIPLPFGQKYRSINKKIQEKKFDFLKEELKVIENNQRMHILKQTFSQSLMFYILNSTTLAITKGWKSTKEQILNDSWK